jgi:putative mRNA 3-end processing factor
VTRHAQFPQDISTCAAGAEVLTWLGQNEGQEDTLVHWCVTHGLKARPLDIVGYGDEEEEDADEPPQRQP